MKNRLGTAFLLQVLLFPALAMGQAPTVLVLKTPERRSVQTTSSSKTRVDVLGNPTQTDAREVDAGFMEVFQQKDADHYAKIGTYPTGPVLGPDSSC